MDQIKVNMPSYPMLRLVASHGRWTMTLVGALLLAGAVLCGFASTPPVVPWAVGVAAVVVFVVGRILVELVELITDMLLPKP